MSYLLEGIMRIVLRCIFTVSVFLIGVVLVAGLASAQQNFPWKEKWHGQTLVIGLVSRGEALKGKHFDGKINRLTEHPWNQIQRLIGGYMVARLDAQAAKTTDPKIRERLAVQSAIGVMSMLSTHQQLYEGHVVYQLDDWRNDDPVWQAVWHAPDLAKALLTLTREQKDALDKICDYTKKPCLAPDYNTFGHEFETEKEKVELEFRRQDLS